MRIFFAFPLLLLGFLPLKAQPTQAAGFDATEYADMLQLNFVTMFDKTGQSNYALKKGQYRRLLRSPEVGLFNRCELYLRQDGSAVLNLRGTVGKPQSWLENFYSGMVAANGSLQLNDSTRFDYRLANTPEAYVHAGWLLGLGYLSHWFNPSIDSLLQNGLKHIIVTGHSQGGALAFLATSYLHYRYAHQYPNLTLTTYASAAPKPGNLYYAYDFDFISRGRPSFRIVNSADWVPESPVSVQGIDDMNKVNPFMNVKSALQTQSWTKRMALMHVYKRMSKASGKAMKRYRKYLGQKVGQQVAKTLPGFQPPAYVRSFNYMTAGNPVVLMADSAYHHKFPFNGKNVFVHHSLNAYMYLLQQYYP